MPRVFIREIDSTTAGTVTSANFSVVVPGFASKDTSGITDENGVYECSSQSDFEENIGFVIAKTGESGAKAANPVVKAGATWGATDVTGTLTAYEFFETYDGCVYTKTEITDTSAQTAGRLKAEIDDKWYSFTLVKEEEGAYSAETQYVVILPGNEGRDEGSAIEHYGNQIAYQLLGMGYTVLYKVMTKISDLTEDSFWSPLKDRSIYNFRYLLSGLLNDVANTASDSETASDSNTVSAAEITVSEVNKKLADVANHYSSQYKEDDGRGDAIALMDISTTAYAGKSSSEAVAAIKTEAAKESTRYGAYIAPSMVYSEGALDNAASQYDNNSELPGSFHYLACAANAFENYPEWYAVAGYTRGISSLSVAGPKVKLGEAAIEELTKRTPAERGGPAVNPIVPLNGTYYIWGNRTANYDAGKTDLVASDFLNIRQLCCTLNKVVYDTCRHLTFDPNSDSLWLNFCNAIRPTLENMKANQGIKDYKFEKKTTSKKAKLFAAIRIVPIEAVEDFEIGISLEDDLDQPTISISEVL